MEAKLLKSLKIENKSLWLEIKGLSENISLKLLCDLIFSLLPEQWNASFF